MFKLVMSRRGTNHILSSFIASDRVRRTLCFIDVLNEDCNNIIEVNKLYGNICFICDAFSRMTGRNFIGKYGQMSNLKSRYKIHLSNAQTPVLVAKIIRKRKFK